VLTVATFITRQCLGWVLGAFKVSYVAEIVKDVAGYVGQLFNELKDYADWIVGSRGSLGDFTACLLLLQLLVRARQLYEDIVYFLTVLMMEGAIRAAARIYMVDADRQLIDSLVEKGLVHSVTADNAKSVLEAEAAKIYERWVVFRDEFRNALQDVERLKNETLSHILDKYTELGCGGVLAV